MLRETWAWGKRPKQGTHIGDPGTRILDPPEKVVKPGKPINLKIQFLDNGQNTTIELMREMTHFAAEWVIKEVFPENTIGDLKRRIQKEYGIAYDDLRVFLPPHLIPEHRRIGECYHDYNGFGMEEWPPQFICKRAVKGFEISVHFPAMRENALWEKWAEDPRYDPPCNWGSSYASFDVFKTTTVLQLKTLIAAHIKIPEKMQRIYFHWIPCEGSEFHPVTCEADDDEATLEDLDIGPSDMLWMVKDRFDKDGNLIFDKVTTFWENDENGIARFHTKEEPAHIYGNEWDGKVPSTDYAREGQLCPINPHDKRYWEEYDEYELSGMKPLPVKYPGLDDEPPAPRAFEEDYSQE